MYPDKNCSSSFKYTLNSDSAVGGFAIVKAAIFVLITVLKLPKLLLKVSPNWYYCCCVVVPNNPIVIVV